MKLAKEDLDKVRNIEGFPLGKDEDIIALSDPPYYTACPNPFIEDFIKKHGKPYNEETDDYRREPFAADVSEGKNDPIYMAHSYHTKVSYKAIMRYLLHFTNPGDIVFDGFCGTGMTGVAAQMCGNPESDPEFKLKIEKEMPYAKWGARKAILNDLSPAATFIAYNYNTPVNVEEFEKEANRILSECEEELGWMYETNHVDEDGKQIYDMTGPIKGKINYTVWSDVFICPNCGSEIILWDVLVRGINNKESKEGKCNKCGLIISLNNLERSTEIINDLGTNEIIKQVKQQPVMIKYSVGNKQYKKIPDENDINLINKLKSSIVKNIKWFPTDIMPHGFNTEQPKKSHNATKVSHFYTLRNLHSLATTYYKIKQVKNIRIKKYLMYWFTSIYTRSTKMNRYMPNHNRHVGPLSGTLYIPYFQAEINIFNLLSDKKSALVRAGSQYNNSIISNQSMTDLRNITNNSIDYIFTDPPFGDSLNYSELSFIWESWLKVKTNNESEAIINTVQGKHLVEYQELMTKCFEEYYRVLKPNRWITVEFHNSRNAVWNAIQESLLRAGFIIADVRTLDKKKGTIKQLSYSSSVKQDLIISAYKPKDSFKKGFLEKAGSEETAWEFIREHLGKLPVVVKKGNSIEIVREREAFLLFDKMVAYHIMNGLAVPIDAPDFYKGLDERFLKRDNMYFLHDQINEYDNARITLELEPIQFSMFVNDEKSAIAWLYHELEEPQTYSDIQPKFMKEAKAAKYEKMPELGELLEENFLQDEEGRWYIPDPSKSGDIMKLREKRLLKEFDEYLAGKGKLKVFRTEAVRVGFAKLWKNKDYENIVRVGNRLPEKVIQEDDKLLMYYDIALSRVE